MTCQYSLIRYVPNPIAEEYINIAIVVFSETEAQCRVTQNWNRVAVFGDENDISMLKEFCEQLTIACANGSKLPIESNREGDRLSRICDSANSWQGVIQVSEPRGSIGNVDEITDDIKRMVFPQ